jgi:transposase
MERKRYTEEFKSEAVKRVVEPGHSVVEVSNRLGLHKHTLYDWVQRARLREPAPQGQVEPVTKESAEIRRLRAELRRVTEERDILKKAAAYFAKG